MYLRVVHNTEVENTKLQEEYFGVWPLRFSIKFKLNRLPADCDIFSYNGFQHIAKFKAGRFDLPANTGKDNSSKTAVITIAQAKSASLCNLIPGLLMFNIVVIKFIAPNKLLTPDKCKEKIAKSTLGPL